MDNYEIFDIVNESEWQALFSTVGFPHMTQTWAFGEAKRATQWRPRRIAITLGAEAIAICQVLYKTVAGLPVVARINLGPMPLVGQLEKAVDVHQAIRDHWRHFFHGVLLIAPAVPYSDENQKSLKAMGFRLRTQFRWTSSRVDLTPYEGDIRKSLTSKWRNQLNKSEQQGLQFWANTLPTDVEWIIRRHVENTVRKGFSGPSPEFLWALYKAAPAHFHVFKATHGGQPVAGMVAYRFGEVAHYYVGWNGVDGRRLNAGNFLLWNASLELKRLGCTKFDVGGHNSASGFGAFKLGMNGASYQLVGEFLRI
jgi:lipid II:glycine glycyltransferase (peptidoglycan interpeptide bridge formation enzyme)